MAVVMLLHGWPWSCFLTAGGGLLLGPYRLAFDFKRRWRVAVVMLLHHRPRSDAGAVSIGIRL